MPSPAASGRHTALVQRVSDPAQGRDARGAYALDYWQHVGREPIGGAGDHLPALRGGVGRVPRIAELGTLHLLAGERLAGPLRDELALLLGEAGVKVQDERIDVGAELRDHERHPVGHEAADEVHVSAQPVELRDNDRALAASSRGAGAGELRTTIQGVGTLARFDL